MITDLATSKSLSNYRRSHELVGNVTAIKSWRRQILSALEYLQNPEDLDSEQNEKSDIYSFGMCVLQMMTKEAVYSEYRSEYELFAKIKLGVKPVALYLVQDRMIVSKEVLYSEYENNKELIFESIQNCQLPKVLYRGEESPKYRGKKSKIRKFIDRCLLPTSERPSAIDLLNDPFLADADVPETSTAGNSAASIQTLTKTVRDQVERLQGRMSDDETVSETSRQLRNVLPNRPPPEAETKVTEKSTAASQSTEQEEEEKEDDTPLIRRRRTTRNVKRGGETFGSQEGSSETVSQSKTHETSTDEQDQTRHDH
ncbi:serine/threonine-protein kinase WNK8-like [Chenopodium quinoa]|uniref:serine/threonine-protein kinase WNK8-like n=1 Tax=Chenopodium quinoa TaxID=63459 RepID=UPI000B77FF68|nr:serine/threonine-protein kinase WNK8-like [Chenopodium quinoa]